MSDPKSFKLHEKVFVVKRVSRHVATVTEGTVIACDPPGDDTARVSWYDESGLCSTSLITESFKTEDAATMHREVVLHRPWQD